MFAITAAVQFFAQRGLTLSAFQLRSNLWNQSAIRCKLLERSKANFSPTSGCRHAFHQRRRF
jgi:hypothetical protein